MSLLVTRPLMPEPCTCEMLTWCSSAMRRTSGEDFCRRRCSVASSLGRLAGRRHGCRRGVPLGIVRGLARDVGTRRVAVAALVVEGLDAVPSGCGVAPALSS